MAQPNHRVTDGPDGRSLTLYDNVRPHTIKRILATEPSDLKIFVLDGCSFNQGRIERVLRNTTAPRVSLSSYAINGGFSRHFAWIFEAIAANPNIRSVFFTDFRLTPSNVGLLMQRERDWSEVSIHEICSPKMLRDFIRTPANRDAITFEKMSLSLFSDEHEFADRFQARMAAACPTGTVHVKNYFRPAA